MVFTDELLFTATHKFFDNMTKEDIIEWANTCMEFVYEVHNSYSIIPLFLFLNIKKDMLITYL